MTKPKKAGIPWTNCRLKLVVSGDVDGREEDPFAHGVVARLHYTSSSHPAVRHSLQALKTRYVVSSNPTYICRQSSVSNFVSLWKLFPSLSLFPPLCFFLLSSVVRTFLIFSPLKSFVLFFITKKNEESVASWSRDRWLLLNDTSLLRV